MYVPSRDALILASAVHPVWIKLSWGAQKLHARNCQQVLGADLNDPVDVLVCWTPNGKETGGTARHLNWQDNTKLEL